MAISPYDASTDIKKKIKKDLRAQDVDIRDSARLRPRLPYTGGAYGHISIDTLTAFGKNHVENVNAYLETLDFSATYPNCHIQIYHHTKSKLYSTIYIITSDTYMMPKIGYVMSYEKPFIIPEVPNTMHKYPNHVIDLTSDGSGRAKLESYENEYKKHSQYFGEYLTISEANWQVEHEFETNEYGNGTMIHSEAVPLQNLPKPLLDYILSYL